MSSKTTIILTADNEHIYSDCSEQIETMDGRRKDAITVEISLSHARVDCFDDYDLVFTLTDPDSEIYALFNGIGMANKLQKALDLAIDQNNAMKAIVSGVIDSLENGGDRNGAIKNLEFALK
jgi:hypothetical protein